MDHETRAQKKADQEQLFSTDFEQLMQDSYNLSLHTYEKFPKGYAPHFYASNYFPQSSEYPTADLIYPELERLTTTTPSIIEVLTISNVARNVEPYVPWNFSLEQFRKVFFDELQNEPQSTNDNLVETYLMFIERTRKKFK